MAENLLFRMISTRPGEARSVLLAFLYHFLVLGGYFVLRPLREEMGLAGGVRNLPNLFLFTLAATAVVAPLFGWCVQRFPRQRMLPIAYRFFTVQLLIFWGLSYVLEGDAEIWLGRVFYVWISVFNLFVVSVFWAFMSDGFSVGQSKRVYGFIAAGGTLGALLGSVSTGLLVNVVGRMNLFLLAAVLLEGAVFVMLRLHREFERMQSERSHEERASIVARREAERSSWHGPLGGAFNGLALIARSPFLLAITAFMLFYPFCSTILYFQQAQIVDGLATSRDHAATVFAWIESVTQGVTLALQVLVTGRFMRKVGVAASLMLLPVLTAIGFAFLGAAPVLAVVVGFQVIRRAANFAFLKPARETLFTIVPREERYKAKSFIDTFVYRGADAIGSVAYRGLSVTLGWTVGTIALAALPVAVVWSVAAWWLGRQHRLAEAVHDSGLQTPPRPVAVVA